jgi:hypothetical protein
MPSILDKRGWRHFICFILEGTRLFFIPNHHFMTFQKASVTNDKLKTQANIPMIENAMEDFSPFAPKIIPATAHAAVITTPDTNTGKTFHFADAATKKKTKSNSMLTIPNTNE